MTRLPHTRPHRQLAGVVLAAGAGTRLRPLTLLRPKALCPVANRPLVDWALDAVTRVTDDVAVNAHHLSHQLRAHLEGRVPVSVEEPVAFGTAGALGRLRDWVGGRDVLVHNADAWHRFDLRRLLDGWDRVRVRLLVTEHPRRPDFGGRWRYVGVCLLPWSVVRSLPAQPAGLFEAVWRRAEERGTLDLLPAPPGLEFVDCGTPSDYLRASLIASGGASVVGPGAVVEGVLVRSVVWPHGWVGAAERLVECVRAGRHLTVAAPQRGWVFGAAGRRNP